MHVEAPPTPRIKSNHDDKLEKDFVILKIHMRPTSKQLDLYGFKIAFFNNGKQEEFLLFIHNFNMTIKASGTL